MAAELTTEVFRLADGSRVFPVWQAIQECPANKQPDLVRISRALAKTQSLTEVEVIELLGKLTEDNLIIRDASKKTAIYSLPESVLIDVDDVADENHSDAWNWVKKRDCYCYECHSAGEVLLCSQCPRVFHQECIRPETALDLPLLPFKEPVPQVIQNTFLQVFG